MPEVPRLARREQRCANGVDQDLIDESRGALVANRVFQSVALVAWSEARSQKRIVGVEKAEVNEVQDFSCISR